MTKPVKPKTLTPGVVKLQTLTSGDHFTLVGLEDLGPWELLRLTPTCATVRSLTTTSHTFTKDGQDVTINSRPKPTTMGLTTLVQREPKQ